MPAAILGPIFSADECARIISATRWDGAATYLLWNRANMDPIYCGTAAFPGRLKSHLKKDNPLNPPTTHNLKNPQLLRYWQSQTKGWMGISFRLFANQDEARTIERQIIAAYGIRRDGGKLLNQRLSG